MAITGVASQQYEDFLRNGGELTLTLDKTDFSKDGEFEQFPNLKDRLNSGFELPPSTIISDPSARMDIYTLGDQWTCTITAVYARGGRIIYRRLANGRYEAKLSIPESA